MIASTSLHSLLHPPIDITVVQRGSSMDTAKLLALVFLLLPLGQTAWTAAGGDFSRDVRITWGDGRAKILDGGRGLSLSLDRASGSGFESSHEFLFGRFDVQLKLIPGNSAGTVTTYYLSSQGPNHDEVDFEFLGNSSGQPYTIHTNVYAQGRGGREQQFRPWFDPTLDYHTYSILWGPRRIVFAVDSVPIREFANNEPKGVPFPARQPMRLYSTLWNADDWATQGGRVKTDWSRAPFTAQYRNISIDGCLSSAGKSSSCAADAFSAGKWAGQEIDAQGRRWLMWVRRNFMIYNYCADQARWFPQGLPLECTL